MYENMLTEGETEDQNQEQELNEDLYQDCDYLPVKIKSHLRIAYTTA